jgi:hypothetical protein
MVHLSLSLYNVSSTIFEVCRLFLIMQVSVHFEKLSNLQTVGSCWLYGCPALTSVHFENLSSLQTVGDAWLDGCATLSPSPAYLRCPALRPNDHRHQLHGQPGAFSGLMPGYRPSTWKGSCRAHQCYHFQAVLLLVGRRSWKGISAITRSTGSVSSTTHSWAPRRTGGWLRRLRPQGIGGSWRFLISPLSSHQKSQRGSENLLHHDSTFHNRRTLAVLIFLSVT